MLQDIPLKMKSLIFLTTRANWKISLDHSMFFIQPPFQHTIPPFPRNDRLYCIPCLQWKAHEHRIGHGRKGCCNHKIIENGFNILNATISITQLSDWSFDTLKEVRRLDFFIDFLEVTHKGLSILSSES